MFQQFNTTTIMGGFIKHLLATTPIPSIDTVVEGDTLVRGYTYLYKGYILECVVGGVLHVGDETELVPSDTLFPHEYLLPKIGLLSARYKVLGYFDSDRTRGYSYNYHSNHSYYDETTHYHLGNYLRYLRDCVGLDLMAYYNCYCGKTVDNIKLNIDLSLGTTFSTVENPTHKVYAIPVRFGKTYTVAINCSTDVVCHVAYYDNGVLLSDDGSSLTESMSHTRTVFPSASYAHPFTVYVNPPVGWRGVDASYLYARQRYLYLLVQVPVGNTSPITVLEGDFTNSKWKQSVISNYDTDYRGLWSKPVIKVYNPSLLVWDGAGVLAFSDRLVEYLLNNVIWDGDDFSENIVRNREYLSKIDNYYANNGHKTIISKSVWDVNFGSAIASVLEGYDDIAFLTDIDGNINKDVEAILYKKYLDALYKESRGE